MYILILHGFHAQCIDLTMAILREKAINGENMRKTKQHYFKAEFKTNISSGVKNSIPPHSNPSLSFNLFHGNMVELNFWISHIMSEVGIYKIQGVMFQTSLNFVVHKC